MKNQALFSSKNKSKKLKCHLLQFFFFGALMVKNKREKNQTLTYIIIIDQKPPKNHRTNEVRHSGHERNTQPRNQEIPVRHGRDAGRDGSHKVRA